MSEVKIIIKGAKGCGKTYIANIITGVLRNHGINVTGEPIDINIDEQPISYNTYKPIEIITTYEGE